MGRRQTLGPPKLVRIVHHRTETSATESAHCPPHQRQDEEPTDAATDYYWTKPAPPRRSVKTDIFELSEGGTDRVCLRTPARDSGLSITAKVKEGREDAIREHGKTIETATPPRMLQFLAALRTAPPSLQVSFDIGHGLTFQYEGIFDTTSTNTPRTWLLYRSAKAALPRRSPTSKASQRTGRKTQIYS